MAVIDLTRLNDAQRNVVTRLDEPLFVAAGAGSGKTFTLTARLVHALSKGSAADGGRYLSSIDEALVITFTKAAALEIAERVRGALRDAGEEDPYLREEALKVDGAWISTIHGMCARILRRHAIELGIDPAFTVCEGSVPEALLARAMDEVLSDVQRDDAYEQLRGEFALWGSSGSTIAGMIRQLCDEAAKCPHGFDDLHWPESHETEHEMASVTRAFEALGALKLTEKQQDVVDAALTALREFAALAPGARTSEAACAALAQAKVPALRKKDYVPLRDEAKQALAEAMVCAQYERVQHLMPQLVGLARQVDARYAQLKHERSYLDNNDLIAAALQAVETNSEVARDYAGRFRLVMIDEFQDTDEKQLRLISLLSGEDAQHLTTVGDAQQSIYRFRGGDVTVFRARGRQLPEASHVDMDVNYRSDAHVLALVEHVCGDAGLLDDFLKLAGNGGRKSSYVAREEDGSLPPRIRIEVAEGGTAELMSATLAAQLADRLATYHAQGQPVGSMALLLGATSRVNLYLDALRARGLPAVVTGGSSFSTTAEVGVVQALLHTLANPHDTETGLFRLLSSDLFRLDADDFCQLGTCGQDVLDAPTKRPIERVFVAGELELYGTAKPSPRLAAAFEVLQRAFVRLGRWELADICQAVIEESGWLARLEQRGPDGLSVAANVLAAVRYVRELTTNLGLGPARAATEFDQWLAAAKLTPKNLVGETMDAVQVMTVHGSKGLQFSVCAVAECWSTPRSSSRLSVGRKDGACMVCVSPKPDVRDFSKMRAACEVPTEWDPRLTVAEWASLLDAQELSEQAGEKARLLYVALTRAEEALVVGVPFSAKEHYQSPLAQGMLKAFPELEGLTAGEHEVSIEPKQGIFNERQEASGVTRDRVAVSPGVARVVSLLHEDKDAAWQANSGGTLAGFDGDLPDAVTTIPLLGTELSDYDESGGRTAEEFELFEAQRTPAPTCGWRAREGVFSYSSAHALMEERSRISEAPAQDVAPVQGVPDEPGHDAHRRPVSPPRAEQEAEAEGAPFTNDNDKATNLGSAFHELAQTMVETRRDHDPLRLTALARTWHLSARATERLRMAVARWEGSELRREAQSYACVAAEVPFFVQTSSSFGDYVEGAIDLLAYNPGESSALVVDYKTGDVGLSLDAIEQRHRMQANFYAWVLMSQGFEAVDCAFCCVEVDDGEGGPVVVRYHFDASMPPRIE